MILYQKCWYALIHNVQTLIIFPHSFRHHDHDHNINDPFQMNDDLDCCPVHDSGDIEVKASRARVPLPPHYDLSFWSRSLLSPPFHERRSTVLSYDMRMGTAGQRESESRDRDFHQTTCTYNNEELKQYSKEHVLLIMRSYPFVRLSIVTATVPSFVYLLHENWERKKMLEQAVQTQRRWAPGEQRNEWTLCRTLCYLSCFLLSPLSHSLSFCVSACRLTVSPSMTTETKILQ